MSDLWEDIFLLNLVLLFGKPKFRFRPWKTVSSEMLEMWKMKNVTLFSLDEQQSNGPFYLLLSDRFTTFAPAGIYAIAPNRQIYIQIVLMKCGSDDPKLPLSLMFGLQKELVHLLSEGRRTRRRRGEGLRDLTAASSLSQDVPRNLRLLLVITSIHQSTSLTKKNFSLGHGKIVVTSYLLPFT